MHCMDMIMATTNSYGMNLAYMDMECLTRTHTHMVQ